MSIPIRRVLIVDDQERRAQQGGERLAAQGYVTSWTTPRDAVAHAERERPHLVLVDASPAGEAQASTLAAELRDRSLPVVLLTDDADDATLHRLGVVEPYGCVARNAPDRELGLTIELALTRQLMARQVHELEARFFSISIDLLCFLDFDGYFKRLNPAWERTLGFSREELMSRPFIEFVHPDDRIRTLAQNRDVRAGGRALEFENRYLCKDGSYRWLLWNAAPDAAEQVIYSVARDVTARKEADAERERLVAELQDALGEVRSLQEILPICSYCKRIRDDENYWHVVESYFARHANARFSHSICPSCYTKEVQPQLDELDR
jgi:PAS domain S-box-containing protein